MKLPDRFASTVQWSPCGLYRYALHRVWDEKLPAVMFVMLNPSSAGEHRTDNTIKRCTNFAHGWGYGGLYVGNLFGYISTDPSVLARIADPVGPGNDAAISEMASTAAKTIVAHGIPPAGLEQYARAMHTKLRGMGVVTHVLSKRGTSYPYHPLYLPATTITEEWTGSI